MKSADAIINNLLYISPQRHLLYVTDVTRRSLIPNGDLQHLSCFIAGLFALGAATIPGVGPRHAWAAEGLAHTCWITYADTATGLGPEWIVFRADGGGEHAAEGGVQRHLLGGQRGERRGDGGGDQVGRGVDVGRHV